MIAKALSPVMVIGSLALGLAMADEGRPAAQLAVGAPRLVTGSIARSQLVPSAAEQAPGPVGVGNVRALEPAQPLGGESKASAPAQDNEPRSDAIVPPIKRVRTSVIPITRQDAPGPTAVARPAGAGVTAAKRQAANLRGRQSLGGDGLCAPGFNYSTRQARCIRASVRR